MVPAPAFAADPVVIVTSPSTGVDSGPVLTVSDLGSGSIVVDNPGSTSPTIQQCSTIGTTDAFCLGTSDQLVAPGSVPLGPVEVQGVPASPFRLPGEAMDWIVDEAVSYVAATKGLQADDLVRAYARPDIRAYVFARLESILNKKLYGEPMTDQETAAYDELQAIYKDRLVEQSKWALEEYDLWSRNPCAYIPPAPPVGTGFPYVDNDARHSSTCSAAGARFSIWGFTKGTPPADTFDRWASYRHPTPAMKASGDTSYRFGAVQTTSGIALAGGYAAALGVTVALRLALGSMSPVMSATIARVLGFVIAISNAVKASVATIATAASSTVLVIIAGLITLGIAIWQLVEDAKPGTSLRDRAAQVAKDNDPLGIEAAQAAYAGLDIATMEEPANPAKVAKIHSDDFHSQLFLQVLDWQMFRSNGDFIPDPTSGYNTTGTTTADDVHFAENGVPKDFVTVRAPAGTLNDQSEPLSGYQVTISRGFLMVAELVSGEQEFRPYQPRTSVRFVDAQGRESTMSLMSVGREDGPPVRQFLIATPDDDNPTEYTHDTSWTYEQHPGVLKTVTLLEHPPLTPQVNVIPSVQGELVADHLLNLDANLSTPGLAKTGGQYTWTVERLDHAGYVVDTFSPAGNPVAFGHRYTEPGDYRAKVTFSWTGPEAGSASGRVEFTVVRRAAEVLSAEVEDDRVNTGALSLDLRMLQNTRSDTFEVNVAWADDGLGNEVVEHYTVQCIPAGANTCDTGLLLAPGPNLPPTNPQWSSPPTFKIPDDHNFLPHVTVTITNSYGETVTRVFPITGEHRPTYASMTPYAEMAAGTDSAVDVVQVFPSDLFDPPTGPGIDLLQIQPFVTGIADRLPPGVVPQIVQKPNGQWWLQLTGKPAADAIGAYTFYCPFEQNVADGNPRRPAPALATLEVVSSTDPGYRGILRGATFDISSYRNAYPDYLVQAAQVLEPGEEAFTDFTGTVKCKLVDGPYAVFDKPCAANQPFPWPDQPFSGQLRASAYVQSGTLPISADGPYDATFVTQFLDPTVSVEQIAPGDTNVVVRLRLHDGAAPLSSVSPPFGASGYDVTRSLDGGAVAPCLNSGTDSFPTTPGEHALEVKVVAPDHATTVRHVTWNGGPLLPPPPAVKQQLTATLTVVPAKADAIKARFDLAVGYGGPVAAPYTQKGFEVTCVADGGTSAPCFLTARQKLLRVPGSHHLSVTVRGPDGQSVTEKLGWNVATPKARFAVAAPPDAVAGERVKVRATGLLPHETYVIKIAGDKVATGSANAEGMVAEKVRISSKLAPGPVKAVVRGANQNRTGQQFVWVLAAS